MHSFRGAHPNAGCGIQKNAFNVVTFMKNFMLLFYKPHQVKFHLSSMARDPPGVGWSVEEPSELQTG